VAPWTASPTPTRPQVSLSNLTIRDGNEWTGGSDGGGIFNYGTLSLSGCTLSGNSADRSGGAILNYYTGNLAVSGSTLSGNSATTKRGGLYNSGAASLDTTTVSSNSAGAQGGGIFNDSSGALTLGGSTVTGNFAPAGADLYNLGKVIKKNSVVGVTGP
jgi:predicted outer membrane repeat protein